MNNLFICSSRILKTALKKGLASDDGNAMSMQLPYDIELINMRYLDKCEAILLLRRLPYDVTIKYWDYGNGEVHNLFYFRYAIAEV